MSQGVAYFEQGNMDLAKPCYAAVLKKQPMHLGALTNLAILYTRLREFGEAEAIYQRILTRYPTQADTLNHLGVCYKEQNKALEAKACFEKALTITSTPEITFNLGITECLLGEFTAGLKHYEARHQLKEHREAAYHLPQPFRRGELLEGKTLFILAEQGMGDTLQYVRFLPQLLAKTKPAKVILECQPPLVSLLQFNYPLIEVVPKLAIPRQFDVQTHLMSLPYFLRLTSADFSRPGGYLQNEFKAMPPLQATLKKRVGFVWAGSSGHQNNRNRSLPLEAIRPLFTHPSLQGYGLQWGEKVDELIDLTPEINDFQGTAHYLQTLDLLITVDTAIAHLAGSLNRPAWLLVPFAPDFRWQLDREDTFWYDSLRLFRQSSPGDWGGVIQRVADALTQFAVE